MTFLDDLPLRTVAACYYWIGRYVGVDTGNYHLMLAVNGQCDVWVPPKGNTIGYSHEALHYPMLECGRDNSHRLNYVEMKPSTPRSVVGLRYPTIV